MSASVQRGAAKLAQRTIARKGVKCSLLPTVSSSKKVTRRGLSSELMDDEDASTYKYHNHEGPSHVSYTSSVGMPISSKLRLIRTKEEDIPSGVWPVFRIMDENGMLRNSNNDAYKFHTDTLSKEDFSFVGTKSSSTPTNANTNDSSEKNQLQALDVHTLREDLVAQYPEHASLLEYADLLRPSPTSFPDMPPHLTHNTLMRCHRVMTRLREMDNILLNAQRQGRISFYLTCRGEEATYVGSASALKREDVMLAQYREQGLLMWRGFTLEQFTNQCCGNDLDLGRGRQMPIHYGSRALNFHTISSPLGTQLPQAVGVGYKKKLEFMAASHVNDTKNDARTTSNNASVSIVYFGEGAASSNDFHAACNFAATLRVPTIFFCRNNGYAISTPAHEQYAGDGIISRGKGYGMASIRVDGNDVLAVHLATKAAREFAIEQMEPVLIEAMTYRQGDHSTSDDSSQYRSSEEVSKVECDFDPWKRLNSFLMHQDWMSEEELESIVKDERKAVLHALGKAEQRPPTRLDTMFEDVYHEMPSSLKRQEEELHEHLSKYPDKYTH